MLGRFLSFLLRLAFRIIVRALWLLLGALLSVAIRLAPFLFRLSVSVTAWTLTLFDRVVEGRLSRQAAFTLLAAGGLWAVVGFLVPVVFPLLLHLRPTFFSLPVLLAGFGYGVVCGFQVYRLPGWRAWMADDSLHLGENTR